MRSGRLNRPGKLYAVTQTYNDAGDETEVETYVCDVWLKFVEAAGREFMNAQQLNADLTHVIRMRDLPGTIVTPNHRIKYDDRTFRIDSVYDEREAHRTLMINAIEDVSEEV